MNRSGSPYMAAVALAATPRGGPAVHRGAERGLGRGSLERFQVDRGRRPALGQGVVEP